MKQMNNKIRILILEDSEDDALLMLHEFEKNHYKPIYERVETAEMMSEALKGGEWEIVLADYTMPSLSALKGLEILRESGCDIPYIVVSGTIGEDLAVEVMSR